MLKLVSPKGSRYRVTFKLHLIATETKLHSLEDEIALGLNILVVAKITNKQPWQKIQGVFKIMFFSNF